MIHAMKTRWLCKLALALLLLAVGPLWAADAPTPKTGSWVVKNFRFNTGEVLPELKLNYLTLGEPTGEPVLILHGTGGTAKGMLSPAFGGELFGPGQPLDAARHYIILPDAIGAGASSKPSDGLRMAFPKYNYEDMVRAQHMLVTQHLGVKQLKLVLGNSMGGMHTWLWGVMYPDTMRHLVPLASMPMEVAGRNWMTRRLLIETIQRDPEWNGGNYTRQPASLKLAQVFFSVATSGGNLGLHQVGPTREKADAWVSKQLTAPTTADANDLIYQFDASRGYNPAPQLDQIRARVLAINSLDDERNPPELAEIMENEVKRVRAMGIYLIPSSPDTRGHGTTGQAKWWKRQLQGFLASDAAPRQ